MPYHHYVSAFHLAEFSGQPVRRRRESRIWVHDFEAERAWFTTAGNAGGETDYNAVRGVPGVEQGAAEAWISETVEQGASTVLREINETQTLPSPAAWESLLTYLALIKVNNPAPRASRGDAERQALTFMGQLMPEQPDAYERAQAECRRDGVPLLGELSRDELQAQLAAGQLNHAVSSTVCMRGLQGQIAAMRLFLSDRSWSLLVASAGAPDFACGDRPMVGLPSMSQEVIVPLGRRTCLLSSASVPSERLLVGRSIVAQVNRRQRDSATRFVYSPESTVLYAEVLEPIEVSIFPPDG